MTNWHDIKVDHIISEIVVAYHAITLKISETAGDQFDIDVEGSSDRNTTCMQSKRSNQAFLSATHKPKNDLELFSKTRKIINIFCKLNSISDFKTEPTIC